MKYADGRVTYVVGREHEDDINFSARSRVQGAVRFCSAKPRLFVPVLAYSRMSFQISEWDYFLLRSGGAAFMRTRTRINALLRNLVNISSDGATNLTNKAAHLVDKAFVSK
jgi:hypothetical protein